MVNFKLGLKLKIKSIGTITQSQSIEYSFLCLYFPNGFF